VSDAGLQGRLADFTLEEILQLIALQQKTGVLTVDASYPMVLAFESGMLVGYRDVRRLGLDPLENFLKAYGYFGSETWEHIDFVQRHSKLDLTEILVNEGVVDADELGTLQMESAQEDIFRGMQLRDGRYQFTPGRDGMAGLEGRVRIKVDGLLMEAVRRIDEIGALRDRFFSNDIKIRLADPTADTSARSATERRLLALLGRTETLGRVVAQARMSEFDTLSTLDGLREDGLVVLQSTPKVQTRDVEASTRDTRHDRMLRDASVVSIVTVLLAVLLGLWQPWSAYRATGPAGEGLQYELARQRARIEAAVQLFEQRHGRLPTSIDALAPEGWLDPDTAESLGDDFEIRIDRATGRWSVRPLSGPRG